MSTPVFSGLTKYYIVATYVAPSPVSLPLTVYSGPVKVTWPLGSTEEVEQLFWDTVHTNGSVTGGYLSHYLDIRSTNTTYRLESDNDEPQVWNLPATINPLQFLLSNLLRGSVMLVRAQSDCMGPNSLNTSYLSLLRQIIPPAVILLMNINTPLLTDIGQLSYEFGLPNMLIGMNFVDDIGPTPPNTDLGILRALPQFNP